jgi:carbon storage regulator
MEDAMLVLSRKRSERIVIGSEIEITIVKLEGNQVRLGIEAPDDVAIFRAELLEGLEHSAWDAPKPFSPSHSTRDDD